MLSEGGAVVVLLLLLLLGELATVLGSGKGLCCNVFISRVASTGIW